jgi:hypothetical protein
MIDEVRSLIGDSFSWENDQKRALHRFSEDGCLILVGATDLSTVEAPLIALYQKIGNDPEAMKQVRQGDGHLRIIDTPDAISKDVITNKVSLFHD